MTQQERIDQLESVLMHILFVMHGDSILTSQTHRNSIVNLCERTLGIPAENSHPMQSENDTPMSPESVDPH